MRSKIHILICDVLYYKRWESPTQLDYAGNPQTRTDRTGCWLLHGCSRLTGGASLCHYTDMA